MDGARRDIMEGNALALPARPGLVVLDDAAFGVVVTIGVGGPFGEFGAELVPDDPPMPIDVSSLTVAIGCISIDPDRPVPDGPAPPLTLPLFRSPLINEL